MVLDEKIREKTIEQYADRVMKINTSLDRDLIEKGLIFMYDAHEGQNRFSGEPFREHPVNVGELLAYEFNTTYVVAGYLHDVVEDVSISLEEIEEKFGTEIADLVDDMSEKRGETRKNHLDRIIKNKRAVPIKFADFIHNIRTSDAVSDYGKTSFLERAQYFLSQTKTEFGDYQLYQTLQNEVNILEKAIKI